MSAAAAAPRTVTATRGACILELPLVLPVALALALALALEGWSPERLAVAIPEGRADAPEASETEAVGITAEALAFPVKQEEQTKGLGLVA